jgi:hypothetical protein
MRVPANSVTPECRFRIPNQRFGASYFLFAPLLDIVFSWAPCRVSWASIHRATPLDESFPTNHGLTLAVSPVIVPPAPSENETAASAEMVLTIITVPTTIAAAFADADKRNFSITANLPYQCAAQFRRCGLFEVKLKGIFAERCVSGSSRASFESRFNSFPSPLMS